MLLEFLYNFSDKELNKKHNSVLHEAQKTIAERKYNWQQKQDNIRNKREDEKFVEYCSDWYAGMRQIQPWPQGGQYHGAELCGYRRPH